MRTFRACRNDGNDLRGLTFEVGLGLQAVHLSEWLGAALSIKAAVDGEALSALRVAEGISGAATRLAFTFGAFFVLHQMLCTQEGTG